MANSEEKTLNLWDHVVELLRRLRTIFLAVIVSIIFVMLFPTDITHFSLENPQYPTITLFVMNQLRHDFLPSGTELIPISWTASIEVYIYVSLVLGIAISSPVIAFEVYKFVNPALYKSERKNIVFFIFAFLALFAFGFFMGYRFVTPAMMRIFAIATEPFDILKIYEFSQFYSLVATSLLVCSIIMTTPLFLYSLIRIGIVEVAYYKKVRKYVYGGILIIIALIDPDPTLITELFLGIPLIIMLEITIRLAEALKKH